MNQIKPFKKIKTISEYHQLMGIPSPEHPLVSVIDLSTIQVNDEPIQFLFSFYGIAIKRNFKGKMRYGHQEYDFDAGLMTFVAPNQVFSFETDLKSKLSGCLILIHPDFLLYTSLAQSIKRYDYFSYAANEALFLSEKEEKLVLDITQIIKQEYHSNIDTFSQEIIAAQIELLLKYSERFYQRQFITRKKANHTILMQLDELLSNYFNSEKLGTEGIPTVQNIAKALNISPNYLSRLLQTLLGQSTKQFVQEKLLQLAKEKLSISDLSISEIAYELGFEHPQSFSKFFKSKTSLSPLEFRQAFN